MIILPSLEIVPAKYNGSTLLSQIPIDGTGDFSVTRATSATRVNGNGLIEVARTNLFLQSAGFEVSGNWLPTNITVTTGSTAAFTAPDNSTNADLITATASVPSFINQNTTIASGTYTISVFAKAGNYGLFRIGNVSSAERAAWFNLNAGVVTGTVNGGTASMQNYGNGWYRCIYTSSGMVSGLTFFAPSDAPNSTNSVSGSSIYFWGAQLETGSFASEYIPTTTVARTTFAGVTVDGTAAANIPRLDYLQPDGTIGCPALLVEPAATNLFLRSEEFDNAYWIKTRTTITANATSAPDGASTADKLVETADSGTHIVDGGSLTTTLGVSYTLSVFAKAAERSRIVIFGLGMQGVARGFDLSNGTTYAPSGLTNASSFSITPFAGGWYRCSVTFVDAGAGFGNKGQIRLDNGTTTSYLGDGTSGVFLWGAQLETGSVATSYIPTTVSGVTRATDVVTNTVASGLIGQTEGTLYAEFTVDFNNRNADILNVNDGSSSNGFFMSIRNSSVVQLIVRRAASNALIFQRTGTYPTGVNKLAVAYKNGDFAICLNGTTAQIDTTSITMPSVSINRVSLGQGFLYTLDQQLRIRAATLYQTRLTNTQLALLTSPYTSYSSMASALSYTLG